MVKELSLTKETIHDLSLKIRQQKLIKTAEVVIYIGIFSYKITNSVQQIKFSIRIPPSSTKSLETCWMTKTTTKIHDDG